MIGQKLISHSGCFLINFRGGAIQFFGTKRHHDKWLRDTENYVVKGCFAMTELGHGSNVCELFNRFGVLDLCTTFYSLSWLFLLIDS